MNTTNIVTYARTTWPEVGDHLVVALVIVGIVVASAWSIVRCYQEAHK